MSQTDRILTEISGKLDRMLRLFAVDTVKGVKTEQEKIELLDSLGFRPVEIAKLLNKSSDNVNVQLNIIRKKRQKATTPQPAGKVETESLVEDQTQRTAEEET